MGDAEGGEAGEIDRGGEEVEVGADAGLAAGAGAASADSSDLEMWSSARPALTGFPHEGPNVFALGGYHWLVVDEWRGLGVFRSTGLDSWQRTGLILDTPGQRPDDQAVGRHADVVVVGDVAYVFYFTHPGDAPTAADESPQRRRSSIQVAALHPREGRRFCDRDEPINAPYLPDKHQQPSHRRRTTP